MKTGKSSAWGGAFEYHWVDVETEENLSTDLDQYLTWCNENFGREGRRWFIKKKKIFFNNEKDLSHFILRWS